MVYSICAIDELMCKHRMLSFKPIPPTDAVCLDLVFLSFSFAIITSGFVYFINYCTYLSLNFLIFHFHYYDLILERQIGCCFLSAIGSSSSSNNNMISQKSNAKNRSYCKIIINIIINLMEVNCDIVMCMMHHTHGREKMYTIINC